MANLFLDELKNKDVDTSYISQSYKFKTGATIVLNYSQDRGNITHCGAMDALDITWIPVAEFYKFNHLHFSSYFLQKGVQADIVHLFRVCCLSRRQRKPPIFLGLIFQDYINRIL